MLKIAYEELPSLAGSDLGASTWITVDQDRIGAFAAATDDHQWIHVDIARAEREIGSTIAHGFLVLSLLPKLASQLLEVTGTSRLLNLGTNRMRFTAPVKAGTAIRLCQSVKDVAPRAGGYQLETDCRFEDRTGQTVCIAESVMIYLP